MSRWVATFFLLLTLLTPGLGLAGDAFAFSTSGQPATASDASTGAATDHAAASDTSDAPATPLVAAGDESELADDLVDVTVLIETVVRPHLGAIQVGRAAPVADALAPLTPFLDGFKRPPRGAVATA